MSNPQTVVVLTKTDAVVAIGQYWPNGAGLSIDIADGDERDQVESAVRFLHAEPAAISANVECGWVVAIAKCGGAA